MKAFIDFIDFIDFLDEVDGSAPPAPDVTAPTLSNPVDTATGQTTASLAVDTNEGNGTLYWVVSTSATPPSKAQVKAGQMHTGAAASDSGSQAVSGTGTQSISGGATGLTATTSYFAHFMHEDSSTNQSSVASGNGFTTSSPSFSPSLDFSDARNSQYIGQV